MTAKFVLDEWSWEGAAKADFDVLLNAVHRLLDRLDVARSRNEGVAMHRDYYDSDLGSGVQLFSALFHQDCPLKFDHDLKQRLGYALDRTVEFDDSGLLDFDAEFGGSIRFSPGVAWAHACYSERNHVAVLPLPLDGVPFGKVPVIVKEIRRDIFFVTEESEHLDFFRSIIELEKADRVVFERIAPSAFPKLGWAGNVWHGLRDFSRPFIEVQKDLVRCLSGLNDHGAGCFYEHGAGEPQNLSKRLSAHIGFETSDENGNTKRHPPSRRDRTRRYRGIDRVFWWHVKLQPHIDRICFLYDAPSVAESPTPIQGRIVIGLFKDHCVLP